MAAKGANNSMYELWGKILWATRLSTLGILLTLCACTAATKPQLPDPLAAGWQGNKVCERLHEDQYQRVLRCSFPPGIGHEKHYHEPHFGYALSGGRMKITEATGVRAVDLPTGTHYVSEGVEWHQVLNVGASEVVYLIIEPK